jgi:hypothetical protein
LSILYEAHDAIQRNLKWLGLYLLIVVPTSAGILALDNWLIGPDREGLDPTAVMQWEIATGLLLAFTYAVAQSIVFTRIGHEMARMMWKTGTMWQTSRKFFRPWFAINLMVYASQKFPNVLMEKNPDSPIAGLALLLMMAVVVCSTPLGACIMWRYSFLPLRETLAPLGRNVPKTAIIICANGFLFLLLMDLLIVTRDQQYLWPLIDIAFGYFDCFMFAAVWALLLHDAQIPDLLDEEM